MCFFCLHLVQGSGFRVQGSWFRVEVAASPPFFIGAMPESSILVTSQFYYTREGIVSHVWCQICFPLVQGSRFGAVVFKSWVTSHNNDTSRPLEKGRKEAPRCRLSEGVCVHMAAVQ